MRATFPRTLIIGLLLAILPDWAAAQTVIHYGDTVLGTVACQGSETFQFAGKGGDRVLLHVTETVDFGGICRGVATCGFDQCVDLRDGSNTLISTICTEVERNRCGNRTRTERGPLLLPADGEYTITVRDADDLGRGNYTLFLQRTNGPMRAEALEPPATRLAPIQTMGEVHTYAFEAAAGSEIVAEMLADSGGIQPRLALYAPSGRPVALPGAGMIQTAAPESGTYTLVVFSALDETGTYRLSVDTSDAGEVMISSIVNAASFASAAVMAPDQISSAFGSRLTDRTVVGEEIPLRSLLGGTTVRLTDNTGADRLAPLFFVSPTQINFLVPTRTAPGPAQIQVSGPNGQSQAFNVQIRPIAPGLFAVNASGSGVAAALSLRVRGDGGRETENVFRFDSVINEFVPEPIDLGPEGDQVFLSLFGTGIRGFSSAVTATVDGVPTPVLGAVPQGEFVGLDQVNLGPLPRSLGGRGEVEIQLTVDGLATNAVTVAFQ